MRNSTGYFLEYSHFQIFNYSCLPLLNLLSDNDEAKRFSAFEAYKQRMSFSV